MEGVDGPVWGGWGGEIGKGRKGKLEATEYRA